MNHCCRAKNFCQQREQRAKLFGPSHEINGSGDQEIAQYVRARKVFSRGRVILNPLLSHPKQPLFLNKKTKQAIIEPFIDIAQIMRADTFLPFQGQAFLPISRESEHNKRPH